ncbi:uncharacterized protein LOC123722073 [Papilio machaon]|uniref:uncharacterized protein LOC123722073 n=1 Tax=Papilio machaon TaxID=76193 RepID=UPI001E663DA7|nr:uncharacterized protein LOC123722073 [Papilio machaon]
MKFFTLLFVAAIGFQAVFSQALRGTSVIAAPATCLPTTEVVYSTAATPAIIQSNAVATSLADTLSLLTVSSLLAEKLPLGSPAVIATVPTSPVCGPYSYLI